MHLRHASSRVRRTHCHTIQSSTPSRRVIRKCVILSFDFKVLAVCLIEMWKREQSNDALVTFNTIKTCQRTNGVTLDTEIVSSGVKTDLFEWQKSFLKSAKFS